MRRQLVGGLCTFLVRVVVALVISAPNRGRLSPLETGCMGNSCRRLRKATGRVATGGSVPHGAGSGAGEVPGAGQRRGVH